MTNTRNLVIDTETTGLFLAKKSCTDDSQPDIMQLGMILVENNIVRAKVDLIVIPEAPIHPKALATHRIDLEMAKRVGVSRRAALSIFHQMVKSADRIVTHNAAFDLGVMATAYHREGINSELMQAMPSFCTMISSTNICKLPGKYGYKWPSLQEAYRLLVNPSGFEGAHSAIVDVEACLEVLKALEGKLPVEWWLDKESIGRAAESGLDTSWVSNNG